MAEPYYPMHTGYDIFPDDILPKFKFCLNKGTLQMKKHVTYVHFCFNIDLYF